MIQRRIKVDRAQLLECFQKFDTGGTGRIRLEDVQNVLSGSDDGGPGITESEWTNVISQASAAGAVAGKAELTFDDFVKLFEPSASQTGSAVAAA